MRNILNEIGIFFINDDNNDSFEGLIEKKDNNYVFKVNNHTFDIKEKRILINGQIDNKKVSFIIFNSPIAVVTSLNEINVVKTTYLIENLFIGKFFDNIKEVMFKEIAIKYSNISSILDLSVFELNFIESNHEKSVPLKIIESPKFVYEFDDFFLKFKVFTYENYKKHGNGQSAIFKEYIAFILSYKNKQNIYNVIDDAKIFENLFSLLIGKCQIIEMNEISDENNLINLKLDIMPDFCEDERGYCGFKLNEKNIDSIFHLWYKNYKKFNGVYDLYFSLKHTFDASVILANYAKILESYHRHLYGDKPDFKDRINDICHELKSYDVFKQIVKDYSKDKDIDEDIKEYSKIVKVNRNYYTHYDKKNKDKSFRGLELIKLNYSLKYLIELLFLKELGLSIDEINSFKRHKFKEITFFDDN